MYGRRGEVLPRKRGRGCGLCPARGPLSRTRKRPISCLQTLLTGRRLSLKEEKSLSWARWRRKNEKYTMVEIPDPKRDVQRTPCAFSKWKKISGCRRLRYKESGEGDTLVAPPPSQWFSNGAIWQCLEVLRDVTRGWGGGCYWHVVGRGQGCCSNSNSAQGSIPPKSIKCQQCSAPGQPSSHVLEHLQRPLSKYRGSPTDLSYTSFQKVPSPSLI